jgi:hypothetical protein
VFNKCRRRGDRKSLARLGPAQDRSTNWFAIKGKNRKDLHCQQVRRLREKELDDEDSQSIQKGSVKPVSVGVFMTFPISQVYAE